MPADIVASSQMLHLAAMDDEDLAVISANLQDAIVRVADMTYLPQTKRFVLAAARFDWAAADVGMCERCMTGLHFERVLGVARTGFDQRDGETMLILLGILFEPAEPPGGALVLTFSGGAGVRLNVECIEGQMRDIGPRWRVKCVPDHPLEGETPRPA